MKLIIWVVNASITHTHTHKWIEEVYSVFFKMQDLLKLIKKEK